MQNIKAGHIYSSGITDYKNQRANERILEKSGESVGVFEGKTRGGPAIVNVGHQTD